MPPGKVSKYRSAAQRRAAAVARKPRPMSGYTQPPGEPIVYKSNGDNRAHAAARGIPTPDVLQDIAEKNRGKKPSSPGNYADLNEPRYMATMTRKKLANPGPVAKAAQSARGASSPGNYASLNEPKMLKRKIVKKIVKKK